MPLAPGTPYRDPNAAQHSEERHLSFASVQSSQSTSNDLTISPTSPIELSVPTIGHPTGNLYIRRQSRLHDRPWAPMRPTATFNPMDYARETYYPEEQQRDVENGLEDTAGNLTRMSRLSRALRRSGTVESERERNLEEGEGVFLTRREKKEWAVIFLVAGLGVCGLCGIIAGLAVSL